MIADYLKFQEVVGGTSEQNHEFNGTKHFFCVAPGTSPI